MSIYLPSLSISFSLSVFCSLSLGQSSCLFICLSVCLSSFCPSLRFLYVYLPLLSLIFHPFFSLSLCLFACLSASSLSVFLSFPVCLFLSISQFVYLCLWAPPPGMASRTNPVNGARKRTWVRESLIIMKRKFRTKNESVPFL